MLVNLLLQKRCFSPGPPFPLRSGHRLNYASSPHLSGLGPRNRVVTFLAVANVFPVVALTHPDSRRLLAARAQEHHVGNVQRRLDFDDSSLSSSPSLDMFLHDV